MNYQQEKDDQSWYMLEELVNLFSYLYAKNDLLLKEDPEYINKAIEESDSLNKESIGPTIPYLIKTLDFVIYLAYLVIYLKNLNEYSVQINDNYKKMFIESMAKILNKNMDTSLEDNLNKFFNEIILDTQSIFIDWMDNRKLYTHEEIEIIKRFFR